MSHSSLDISYSRDVAVVDFSGVSLLDAPPVEAVQPQLLALVEGRRAPKVVLDMREVHFLASRMVGLLVSLHRKARQAGGEVVICGLAPNLRRVFEVSRLDDVLRFAPDVKTALRDVERAESGDGAAASPAPREGWKGMVKAHLKIFFSGALLVVPLAITVWVILALGAWLDGLGRAAIETVGGVQAKWLPHGLGSLVVLVGVYVVGLSTRFWIFNWLFGLLERAVTRVPGVKTIYESVRDLMRLFGGESRRMGRVVQYSAPGADVAALGILTNESPLGAGGDTPGAKVAVYFTLSYMIGGPTLFVSRDRIAEVDMSVEQCLKVCTMAHVGGKMPPPDAAGGEG